MKKIITLLLSFCLVQSFFAQLKIVPGGNVGIGTTNPIARLHVNGRIFLTGNGHIFRILPDNPGTEIGSSTDRIDFWYSNTGHNKLYAQKFYTQSDSGTKENIEPIANAAAILQALNGYSYDIRSGEELSAEFGLMAQEVELVAPALVDTSKGIKLLNYNGIIPLLVEAYKEQQQALETLNAQYELLAQQQSECCGSGEARSLELPSAENPADAALLRDNIPNPFTESTLIGYRIPQRAASAMVNIYDLQGKEIRSYNITGKGEGSITIAGNELQAGIYLYTLIVDNSVIDTRKMVRTSR